MDVDKCISLTCLNSFGYEILICGLDFGVPKIEEMMFFFDAKCELWASSCDSPLRCM